MHRGATAACCAHAPVSCVLRKRVRPWFAQVDVWSVGVIFYQLLYKKRPFGDDMTQKQIITEGIILSAHEVKFPDRPVVSQEARVRPLRL